MKMAGTNGPFEHIGFEYGTIARNSIRQNVKRFHHALEQRGFNPDLLAKTAKHIELSRHSTAELEGIREATGIPFRHINLFDLIGDAIPSSGCTVGVATGDATATGGTVFIKQSDKRGADDYEGDDYHNNQEINVIRVIPSTKQTNKIIGVSAAGSTGVKMGINEHGVCIGSNASRTTTFDEESMNPEDWATSSRGDYMKRALLHGDTALEAATYLYGDVLENPMLTPGNITIADSNRAIVVECEYTHVATRKIENGVICRANKFQIMDELSRKKDEIPSSYARYSRAKTYLEELKGSITATSMRNLSVDHHNGPGLNSICRHQEISHTDETSLSTAIFDIRNTPKDTSIYIALGKPCHSWRSDENDGWITLNIDDTSKTIPDELMDGTAWQRNYTETPADESTLLPDLD